MRAATPPAGWALAIAWGIGLLLGLGFVYGAAMVVQDFRHMRAVGVASEGVVIGAREVRSTGYKVSTVRITYSPVVRFRTADGTAHEAVVPERFERGEVVEGRQMRVVYDPADLAELRLAETLEAGPGAMPWGLGGLGLALTTASLAGFVHLRRRRSR